MHTTSDPGMHFVYLLSPDFAPYLHISLKSLLASGTSIASVTVLSVGGPLGLDFEEEEMLVDTRVVPDVGSPLWMVNRVHLCDLERDRIVYLDADTLVLESLDSLVRDRRADMLARPATVMKCAGWDDEKWSRYLRAHGSPNYYPVLNAGLLVFRNGVHRRLGDDWMELMREAYHGERFGSAKHASQWSLPPALGRNQISFEPLSAREHAYAWEGDAADDALLYHTGTDEFFRHARRLERRSLLEIDHPGGRPGFLWSRFQERCRNFLKRLEDD